MKGLGLKICALFLTVWYCFSVIGFDVHTCRASDRTFVTTILNGLSCEDIHPEHKCDADRCGDMHGDCCTHSSAMSESDFGTGCCTHTGDRCCHSDHEECSTVRISDDVQLTPLSCCSNDYQALTLTGCTSDDNTRHLDSISSILLSFCPDFISASCDHACQGNILKSGILYKPIAGRDVQSLLNIWRI